MWQSYWILRDTLEFAENPPKVVVQSVLSMRRGTPTSEAYNRLNIDGMRFGRAKFGSMESSVLPEESRLSYVFPLLRFKDRWRELNSDDLRYFWETDNIGFNGYLMRGETFPATSRLPVAPPLECYEFPDITWEYLGRIRELCEENGIELILFKSPAPIPHWYSEWDRQISEYAELHSLTYYNMIALSDEIGIDLSIHTPNQGQNMNVHGAELLSRWLGTQLSHLPDHRNNSQTLAEWERLISAYERHRTMQLYEFAAYGEIRTVTWN
jgi:hypothetical protein